MYTLKKSQIHKHTVPLFDDAGAAMQSPYLKHALVNGKEAEERKG